MKEMEYTRKVSIEKKYDVVVCGGGPAGFCAAIQAARSGCRTAVIERNGILGGILTSGGNDEIALFFAEGKQIIAGIGWEFVQRLNNAGWAEVPNFQDKNLAFPQLGVRVNIPMAAKLLDDMCIEAGVDILYYQPCVDVVFHSSKEDGNIIDQVIISSKAGLIAIQGDIFIDCTGDGDIAAWSGAPFELGDHITGELQPGTYRFFLTGYDIPTIDMQQMEKACADAFELNELSQGDIWPEKKPNYKRLIREFGNNANHIYHVNGADSDSMTRSALAAHASVARVCNWLRNEVKGAENVKAISLASDIGIRESRRIIGETYITVDQYLSGHIFDDAICYAYYPVDLHRDTDIYLVQLAPGIRPTIPYGALLPKSTLNLLVAGRCISSDRLANAGLRVKAPCMAMGQAAGAAAALAIQSGCQLRHIDIHSLRQILNSSGALVPLI